MIEKSRRKLNFNKHQVAAFAATNEPTPPLAYIKRSMIRILILSKFCVSFSMFKADEYPWIQQALQKFETPPLTKKKVFFVLLINGKLAVN